MRQSQKQLIQILLYTAAVELWHRKSMSILPVEHFSAFDLAKFLLDTIEGEDLMTCAAASRQWVIA